MLLITIGDEKIEYNQSSLMGKEASMIQKYSGRTMGEWAKGIEEGDVDCIAPLVWLIRKRQGQCVKFEKWGEPEDEGGWDFDLGKFDVEDLDEKKKAAEDAEDDAAADPSGPASPESESGKSADS